MKEHIRSHLLPWIVPILGLIGLAGLGVAYEFAQPFYLHILRGIGTEPFRYPFIDWEYVGAGVECWNRGVDVYIQNPCDVLLRPHGYSPLWLRATFIPVGRVWTNLIGIALGVGFFLCLSQVLRPVQRHEVLYFAPAAVSTMVAFAVERGNVDVLLFLVIVAAGRLAAGPFAKRLGCYALLLSAGLLKFYPLVSLVIVLRESARRCVAIGLVAVGIVAWFCYHFAVELAAMRQNIPSGSPMGDMFGASNLPVGLAAVIGYYLPVFSQTFSGVAMRAAILVLLTAAAVGHACWLMANRAFRQSFIHIPDRERTFMVLGSALIAGCFLTGQSVGYRGIYLLFFLGGLVALRRCGDGAAIHRKITYLIYSVIFLMWEGAFRHLLQISGDSSAVMSLSVELWFVRESLWWYMVSSMLAVLATFSLQTTCFTIACGWFRGRSTVALVSGEQSGR